MGGGIATACARPLSTNPTNVPSRRPDRLEWLPADHTPSRKQEGVVIGASGGVEIMSTHHQMYKIATDISGYFFLFLFLLPGHEEALQLSDRVTEMCPGEEQREGHWAQTIYKTKTLAQPLLDKRGYDPAIDCVGGTGHVIFDIMVPPLVPTSTTAPPPSSPSPATKPRVH